MNTHPHLEETLQRDIDLIRSKVAGMAALSERAIEASLQALATRNRQLAYSIILGDRFIDELETELDRLCLEFLVRHQPAAGHLRFVFAAILINRELERIGDYAESIARQVLVVSTLEPQPPYGRFLDLGRFSIRMLREAVRSFLEQDAELASRTMPLEEQGNSMRNSINAEIRELIESRRLPAASAGHLATIARRLERVTDQAKNLCEEVLYMCTGEFVKHRGAEECRILFLDSNNNCLGPMAEGLARAMRLPGFLFTAAAVSPRPVEARTVQFMAGKDIDISGQTTRAIQEASPLEQYQVIIALDAKARDALPLRLGKTILFTWPIQDPSEVNGAPETVRATFESACQALEAQLQELAGAILQEPHSELKP